MTVYRDKPQRSEGTDTKGKVLRLKSKQPMAFVVPRVSNSSDPFRVRFLFDT